MAKRWFPRVARLARRSRPAFQPLEGSSFPRSQKRVRMKKPTRRVANVLSPAHPVMGENLLCLLHPPFFLDCARVLFLLVRTACRKPFFLPAMGSRSCGTGIISLKLKFRPRTAHRTLSWLLSRRLAVQVRYSRLYTEADNCYGRSRRTSSATAARGSSAWQTAWLTAIRRAPAATAAGSVRALIPPMTNSGKDVSDAA